LFTHKSVPVIFEPPCTSIVLFAVFRTNCCSCVLIVSGRDDGHYDEETKDKAQKKIMSMIIYIYRKNYNVLY